MKRSLLSIIAAVCSLALYAQDNPVSWNWSLRQEGDSLKVLILDAAIGEGFHLYDLGPYPGGPTPTSFTFETEGDAVPEGGVEYGTEPQRSFDSMFGMEIGSFTEKASFVQKFRCSSEASVKVTIEWMCCNDVS